MDVHGNLTDQSEFEAGRYPAGRRVRFVSWLGEDFAIGLTGDDGLGIYRVSANPPERTIFEVFAVSGGFGIGSVGARDKYVVSRGDRAQLRINYWVPTVSRGDPFSTDPELQIEGFKVDFVEDCWFALNNRARDHVFDCAASVTDDGNPILLWPWNGGDNQRWRAATVGPGL